MTFPNARLVRDLFLYMYYFFYLATGHNVNRNKEAFVSRRIFHLSHVAHRARISSNTDRRTPPVTKIFCDIQTPVSKQIYQNPPFLRNISSDS